MPSFWQPSIKISTNENLAAEKIAVPYIFDIFQMVSYHAGRLFFCWHFRLSIFAYPNKYQKSFMQHHLTNEFKQETPPANLTGETVPPVYGRPGLGNLLVSISLSPGQIVLAVPDWVNILKGNESLMSRTSTHLVLILLAILAITLRNTSLSWNEIRAIQPFKYLPSAPAASTIDAESEEVPLTLPASWPA